MTVRIPEDAKMDQLFRMTVTTADNVLFTYNAPVHEEGKVYDAFEKVSCYCGVC